CRYVPEECPGRPPGVLEQRATQLAICRGNSHRWNGKKSRNGAGEAWAKRRNGRCPTRPSVSKQSVTDREIRSCCWSNLATQAIGRMRRAGDQMKIRAPLPPLRRSTTAFTASTVDASP